MTRLVVVGAGYVGLTVGACLASRGHHVVVADTDAAKVNRLRRSRIDIFEPELAELVEAGLDAGRISFVVGASAALRHGPAAPEIVMLCLPTPMAATGEADLSALDAVAVEVRTLLPPGCIVVCKSTVPVGTAGWLRDRLDRPDVHVVSNPEFLQEGSAVANFLHADRVVIGADDLAAADRVAALYERFDAPAVVTDNASAEIAKYAANSFLAMKLSYINAVAEVCDRAGADIADVVATMGYDDRIGAAYLRPGPGWGGSCLPKDVSGFWHVARAYGVDFSLLSATMEMNARQGNLVLAKIRAALGDEGRSARVGVLGLTFKAGSDDLRESPAMAVVQLLATEQAEITVHDPMVSGPVPGLPNSVTVVDNPYQVAKGSHVVVLLTDWPAYRDLDWARIAGAMDGRVIVDTRNHLEPGVLRAAGLTWQGLGRPGA